MYLAGNSGNELQVAQFIFQFRTQSAHLAHAHSPAMSLFSRPKGRPKMCNLKINCAIHCFFLLCWMHIPGQSSLYILWTQAKTLMVLNIGSGWESSSWKPCETGVYGTNAEPMRKCHCTFLLECNLFVVVKRSKKFNFQAWNDISTMGLKRTWIKKRRSWFADHATLKALHCLASMVCSLLFAKTMLILKQLRKPVDRIGCFLQNLEQMTARPSEQVTFEERCIVFNCLPTTQKDTPFLFFRNHVYV